MAPAIAHFLVGASLLLLLATPLVLRYEIDRAHVIWLIPIGGVWGLAPDVHHVAPVYAAELYAFHESAWADAFAFHYTLDRPFVRARYHASVFGSIALFVVAVAIFQAGPWIRDLVVGRRSRVRHALGAILAGGGAACYATAAVWVVVSLQSAFATVAALVGSESPLVGSVALVPLGLALGLPFALGIEALGPRSSTPYRTVARGGLLGVGYWIAGVAVLVPAWVRASAGGDVAVPVAHAGSLAGLVVYGIVFGVAYHVLTGVFRDPEAATEPSNGLVDRLRRPN